VLCIPPVKIESVMLNPHETFPAYKHFMYIRYNTNGKIGITLLYDNTRIYNNTQNCLINTVYVYVRFTIAYYTRFTYAPFLRVYFNILIRYTNNKQ